jgi:hypothetical protein
MTFYTGWQYLLIDAATQFGHDKMTFGDRIEWTEANLPDLETLVELADTKPLYIKAVMAIRKAQQGIPTGHLVGMDGSCSGIQMMSVLTACIDGANSTGLVDPDRRADAYSECTVLMNKLLDGDKVQVTRKEAKQALMTVFYGSKAQPKLLFGPDTPELEAFYAAAQQMAPGPWELLQELLASWQSDALEHSWVLPDGFHARIKVMLKQSTRIKVEELDYASFTYEYYANEPIPIGHQKSKANAANVVHSVDAYVLRSMHRRCNYDREVVNKARALLSQERINRRMGLPRTATQLTGKAAYYVEQYKRSTVADVVILPHLDADSIQLISDEHLESLLYAVNGMLQYRPCELVTIHDEFKSHPNNMNWVRWQYKEILAEIAESRLLDDLLTQIYKTSGSFTKMSTNLSDYIRQSNYGLC